jgi:hypothetical protein
MKATILLYIRINAAASVEAIFLYISDSIFLIIKKAKKGKNWKVQIVPNRLDYKTNLQKK